MSAPLPFNATVIDDVRNGRISSAGWAVSAYVLLAGLLGGGGTPSPIPETILQLSGVVLAAWVVMSSHEMRTDRRAFIMATMIVALPLFQIVPLPAEAWKALPGREILAGSLALVGADSDWHALSIAPWATLASVLAMIPAVVILIAAASLSQAERTLVMMAIFSAALIGVLLGGAQLAGIDSAYLYDQTHRGSLVGFYASRNAMVDHLLIALLSLPLVIPAMARRGSGTALAAAIGIVFVIAIFLTGSRAGALLLLPVLAVTFLLSTRQRRTSRRSVPILLALIALAGAALIWLADRRADLVERFVSDPVGRWQLWSDGLAAITQYWPFGAGVGTFRQAYLPFESRSALDYSMPNRMHNDYLELALEAGLPGLLLLGAIIAVVIHAALRRYWRVSELRRETVFASAVLLVIALHAVVDYPLRTMALSTFVAFAVGVLLNTNRDAGRDTTQCVT